MMIRLPRRALGYSRFTRNFSIKVSEEIKQALNDKKKPVVSLESTIITHGLPFPQNLAMATEVEDVIRANGAIPATCAFIDGVPYVGLNGDQLNRLSEEAIHGKINKVSRRDIGYTMAQKQCGGTTIASTMILSNMAGIKVFATGGLGGVHKDAQLTMDVSADLTELGRTPVSVVCAGPKSILDIGLTMEYLETQGVFVGTYNEEGIPNIDVPGFYCRQSGIKSPYSFQTFKEAASIIHNQNNVMGLQSGNLMCIPPPVEFALSSDFINGIIEAANLEAKQKGISGKQLTPYLLSKIAQDTNGRSVECNVKFVLNNAKSASEIAKELLRLETNEITENVTFQPSTKLSKNKTIDQKVEHQDIVDTIIIGSIALDTISSLNSKTMNDSNPGKVSSSIGGVGYNTSLAYNYGSQSKSPLPTYRLITALGDDFAGHSIIKQLQDEKIDTSGIYISKEHRSAQYVSMHDKQGDLVVACADMNIVEQDFMIEHIKKELARGKPRQVMFDCNISPSAMNEIMEHIRNELPEAKLIIEPTSSPKSRRISQVSSSCLKTFPSNTISLITPTMNELESIYESFASRELFDDYDNWFPVLDSLGINSEFRDKINNLSRRHEIVKTMVERGTFQQSFQLLPYIPNILVKLGEHGVILISINKSIEDFKSIPTTSKYAPTFTLTSTGREFTEDNDQKQLGIVIQYFTIPKENEHLKIVNVTGAGDSFIGYLSSSMITGEDWLASEIANVEQEWAKWEGLYKSQLASGMSLCSSRAISQEIKKIT